MEGWLDGKPIAGAVHESLRLYTLCKGMRWAHLPVAGGIYAQSPRLLDDFMLIMGAEADHEKQVQERTMNEKNKTPNKPTRGGRNRRRGR